MKADNAQQQDHNGSDLVTRERADNSGLLSKELVKETEHTVANEIEMKVLALETLRFAEPQNQGQEKKIKKYFNRHGRPTRMACGIIEGEPRRRAFETQATTTGPTANAAQ